MAIDEHARRMTQMFLDGFADFREGRISMLDLSGIAGQTAATLDNASAPLPMLLRRAETELESAFFTTSSEDHVVEAAQIVAPILAVAHETGSS